MTFLISRNSKTYRTIKDKSSHSCRGNDNACPSIVPALNDIVKKINEVLLFYCNYNNKEGVQSMTHAIIPVEEGKYGIRLQTLKKDADEPSAMANYLSQMAIVTKQDHLLTLSLLLQSQQTITGFQIENQTGEFEEAMDKQVDEEMDRRFEMFSLSELPAILHARVQYEVEHEGKVIKGDEVLRLSFSEESLEKVE